jgi:anti-sigma factor RsiW
VAAHPQYTELMSLILDGEAAPDQRQTLRRHLQACSDCAVVWSDWQSLDATFRAAPMVSPAPGLASRVAARLQERDRWRASMHWLGASVLIGWLVITALALLFAGAAFWWGFTHPFQASTVLSAGALALSGVLWPIRSVEMAFATAGLSLWTGIGGCLVMTGMLSGLWLWLASRRPAFAPARVQ